jgi:glutathione synthase/RimK-type ligase-like ATP-grasp enzyme
VRRYGAAMPSSVVTIGVLVPGDGSPPPPTARPIGRVALLLTEEGIQLVFGSVLAHGAMDGLVAEPEGWRAVRAQPLDAVHDRFPSQIRASVFQQILGGLGGLQMSNPLDFTMMCRDKVLSQRLLEEQGVPMPALQTEPERFAESLAGWGAGFIKPRFGALGQGVSRVVLGMDIPRELPGVVPGRSEPTILQQAVEPPEGWAGIALRVLVQRTPSGWHRCPVVVRTSLTDPVANVARGASVGPGDSLLSTQTRFQVEALCDRITEALDTIPQAQGAVEIGVDMVLDAAHRPHLIELNSRPRGRLEVLAAQDPERFGQVHLDAVARPLRTMAAGVLRSR